MKVKAKFWGTKKQKSIFLNHVRFTYRCKTPLYLVVQRCWTENQIYYLSEKLTIKHTHKTNKITSGFGTKAWPGITKRFSTVQRCWDMMDSLLRCLPPVLAVSLYWRIKNAQISETELTKWSIRLKLDYQYNQRQRYIKKEN